MCGMDTQDFQGVSGVSLPLGTDSHTDPDKGLWELVRFCGNQEAQKETVLENQGSALGLQSDFRVEGSLRWSRPDRGTGSCGRCLCCQAWWSMANDSEAEAGGQLYAGIPSQLDCISQMCK